MAARLLRALDAKKMLHFILRATKRRNTVGIVTVWRVGGRM